MTSSPVGTDPELLALADLLAEQPSTDTLTDADRLAAVLALGLHDPERTGPRLAGLLEQVAQDLGTSVALVNGVLPDVQVLAGAHGVDGWLAEARATPVEWSLCQHVVRTGEPRLVPDLAADPSTADNPLLTVDGLQAYAGVPLRAEDGSVVGALCVMDSEPRAFGPETVARLRAAAAEALVLLSAPPQEL